MQWIPSEKKEQSDALFDGQVTEVYLIDGHALPPSAIHEALAQPEQEPVAYWNFNSGFSHCMIDQLNEAAKKNPAPIYTTPPQRKWVGLTDEEITELHHEIKVRLMGTYKTEDIYRAIEAKLREKNGE